MLYTSTHSFSLNLRIFFFFHVSSQGHRYNNRIILQILSKKNHTSTRFESSSFSSYLLAEIHFFSFLFFLKKNRLYHKDNFLFSSIAVLKRFTKNVRILAYNIPTYWISLKLVWHEFHISWIRLRLEIRSADTLPNFDVVKLFGGFYVL